MFKTTSYIFRQLCFATIFVTIVLTSAVWLTQSMRFIDVVINKGLPLGTFFYLVMFLLPDLVGVVLPGAVLVSVLFTYNRLIADNELFVMRSMGFSHWQLAKPAFILAVSVTTILYGISLYILPHAFRHLKDLEHQIRHTISQSMLQEGEFISLKGLTVYFHARKTPTEITGIILHDIRDPEKPFTITAEHGSLLESKSGINLVLVNGVRHEIDRANGTPSMLYFKQYTVDLNPAALPEPRYRKPYEYFINDLLDPPDHILVPAQRRKFQAQGHYRILSPLYVLAFVLIGVSILLYGDFNRRGRTKRVLCAVLFCCLLQVSTIGLVNAADKILFALPAAYIVLFIAILWPFSFLREITVNQKAKRELTI